MVHAPGGGEEGRDWEGDEGSVFEDTCTFSISPPYTLPFPKAPLSIPSPCKSHVKKIVAYVVNLTAFKPTVKTYISAYLLFPLSLSE